MTELSERLKAELTGLGASLVRFAYLGDLAPEQRQSYEYGISIAVALKPEIINGIGNSPTKEYYDEYCSVNRLLDSLDGRAEEIIKEHGFNAFSKTRANVKIDYKNHATVLPHKTVATRAGLGWIGKCALLVTDEFGSAVRISSVLTDAPLEAGTPINESKCGSCSNCVRNCPAEALSGDLWSVDKERETFYNYAACRKKALERTWRISPGETHCGLCILVCPRTKKYIKASGIKYGFPPVDLALKGDLEEILELQKLAFQSQAVLYNDYSIPPLTQTIEQLREEAKETVILKMVEDRKIVGAVRAFEKNGTCYIGKLIVHPGYQNKGLGKRLMEAIEKCFKNMRYELFTGYMDLKNLSFYEKLGYKKFKTVKINEKLELIYFEKLRNL